MVTKKSFDGIYEFEIRPGTHGVWIKHLKEGTYIYLFPDDIAEMVRFLAEVASKVIE